MPATRLRAVAPVAAVLFLAVGSAMSYRGVTAGSPIGLYLVLAFACGFTADRWSWLPLALVPWPLGLGIRFIAGQPLSEQATWSGDLLTGVAMGAVAIFLGLLARRLWRMLFD